MEAADETLRLALRCWAPSDSRLPPSSLAALLSPRCLRLSEPVAAAAGRLDVPRPMLGAESGRGREGSWPTGANCAVLADRAYLSGEALAPPLPYAAAAALLLEAAATIAACAGDRTSGCSLVGGTLPQMALAGLDADPAAALLALAAAWRMSTSRMAFFSCSYVHGLVTTASAPRAM